MSCRLGYRAVLQGDIGILFLKFHIDKFFKFKDYANYLFIIYSKLFKIHNICAILILTGFSNLCVTKFNEKSQN